MDRMTDSGSVGWAFESPRDHQVTQYLAIDQPLTSLKNNPGMLEVCKPSHFEGACLLLHGKWLIRITNMFVTCYPPVACVVFLAVADKDIILKPGYEAGHECGLL